MHTITTIGLDIAKSVFQVHGVDAAGQVVIRRQLKRRHVLAFFQGLSPCLVGIEACASSHHWSRELQVLGHTVRLMSPAYVKPYVKRQKNDTTDAEAICEAVTRANNTSLRITLPRGFKIRHRFLPRRRVASIMGVLRHSRRDRPKPLAICRRSVRPHDAGNVLLAVEDVIIIVRPFAAQAGFKGAFEGEHELDWCPQLGSTDCQKPQ